MFQIKHIAKILELSDEYVVKDLFLNPTYALYHWNLHDREKLEHLPFLAEKTLAYETDLGGFQAKALQDVFNVSNISSTQVREYYKNHIDSPTESSLCDMALDFILSSPRTILNNNVVEKQGINLIQQTGGPVYCTMKATAK